MQIGPYTLRPYQIDGLNHLRQDMAQLIQAWKPTRSLFVGPTGSGKSVIALALMGLAVDKGQTVGFITTGRQLIFQMAAHLEKTGLNFTVLMNESGYDYSSDAPVRVISKDTLEARIDKMPFSPPQLLIVDEADIAISPKWLRLLQESPFVVGLTATPCRANGKGLPWYESMTVAAGYQELIAAKNLVKIVPWGPVSKGKPDLTGVTTSAGDYNQRQLGERMNTNVLIGQLVGDWRKITKEKRPTAVFCVDQAHTVGACEHFCGMGVRAEYILDVTPQEERQRIFDAMLDGSVQVLCSCATLNRGWDQPCVSCGILARPTKSFRLYRQMIGRLMRPYPGKADAILIDHSGAVDYMCEHFGPAGWPDGDVEWKLAADECAIVAQPSEKGKRGERVPYTCPNCAAMWLYGNKCPNCGFEHRKRGQPIRMIDGTLREIKHPRKKQPASDYQKFWCICLGWAKKKQKSYRAAAGFFHSKTEKWPENCGCYPTAKPHQREMLISDIWPNWGRKGARRHA